MLVLLFVANIVCYFSRVSLFKCAGMENWPGQCESSHWGSKLCRKCLRTGCMDGQVFWPLERIEVLLGIRQTLWHDTDRVDRLSFYKASGMRNHFQRCHGKYPVLFLVILFPKSNWLLSCMLPNIWVHWKWHTLSRRSKLHRPLRGTNARAVSLCYDFCRCPTQWESFHHVFVELKQRKSRHINEWNDLVLLWVFGMA